MIEPCDGGARRQGVAQQEAAAAADIEQPVLRLEGERVEDRAAREVVYVVGAVYLARAAPRGPPRDAVHEPVLEGIRRKLALLPRGAIVVTETELPQVSAARGAGSALMGSSN